MASASELDRVAMVVLRYMRGPLFILIIVYAIGITGMALIPGQDAEGNPATMSLFHAFYFFTYTATTTGFGEIPNEFTDEQRLWTIFCLYMGVIAWLYAITSIIRVAQNPHFTQALAERQFARAVKRISEPFFIICGFGDTGSLLARGLSDNFIGAVVTDSDLERVKALGLRDYRVPMPGVRADAGSPKHLVCAGIKHPQCKAVVTLTNDDDTNLKIAVMTRFLNPAVRVICRSTSPRHQEHLRALKSVEVINPFELFAQQLSTALTQPHLHTLTEWLVGAEGVSLERPLHIPAGDWILCGYGRMGQELHKYFTRHAFNIVIIDPDTSEVSDATQAISRHADHSALTEAGIQNAAGIVAGTDSDADNLSILLTAWELNPDTFAIVRQNNHENQLAFDSANADLIMQPSLITARKILLSLISPLTRHFLEYQRKQKPELTERVVRKLQRVVGDAKPHLWSVNLNSNEAAATIELVAELPRLTVSDLVRDPRNAGKSLPCTILVIERDGDRQIMPEDDHAVQPGDEILFCGQLFCERMVAATLNNPHTLRYFVTGVDAPRGYLFQWLTKRWSQNHPVGAIFRHLSNSFGNENKERVELKHHSVSQK